MSIFNTISIDDNIIWRGNSMTLKREYIYAGEYETCTGKRCGDLVGWRYADISIEWDNLPQSQLVELLALEGREVEFTFADESNTSVTEKVIPRVISSTASRYTDPQGDAAWLNISLELSFTEAHN